MRRRQGFTLIELILTLALVSILFSIAIPNIKMYSDYLERKELNTIKRDLLFVRTRSITERKSYDFNIDDDGYGYYIVNQKARIKEVRLENGIRFRLPSKGFRFSSTGRVSTAHTINIEDRSGQIYELKVGVNTGKVTLERVK